MNTKTLLKTLLALSACLHPAAQAATLLLDSSGELLGAQGVTVGTRLYDVQFVEGNCNAGSPACVITFTDSAAATEASQALLDQVFIGIYDSTPAQTFGISSLDYGYALTPYSYSRGHVLTQAAKNTGGIDSVVPITVDVNVQPLFSYNSASDPRAVFAVWTPNPTPVPLPGALLLFSSALGLMGFASRRRR